MVSCCCLHLCCLWGQMVKAYKYMGKVLSVTHTSERDPAAESTRKLSNMDINRLEEQYHCIKQKQKLQTHIIVFKTGENEPMTAETLVTTVPVNKKVEKPKAFEERIPVRGVTLAMLGDGSLQDQTDPWHVHLDIHRLVHAEDQDLQFNVVKDKIKHVSFDNARLNLMQSALVPQEDSAEKHELTHSEHGHTHVIDSSSEAENGSGRSIQRKPSWKPLVSAALIHNQMSSVNHMSATNKLYYYPFPQKKAPRISEAARRLGLYVTH